jgi:hypothetical protein
MSARLLSPGNSRWQICSLERAIGVIYLPETERASHYFDATLPRQFDAVIHCDETSALEPLVPLDEPVSAPSHEAPEAHPTGL